MSRSQLMKMFGVGNGTLSEWLRGTEPPEWTRRPRAKDDLHDQAVVLRRGGATVPEIAEALGISKSTAYLWTRDQPLQRTPAEEEERRRRHMEHMREARPGPHRELRDAERAATNERFESWVGELSVREVVLLGAVAYWCDGAKEKPGNHSARGLGFINSDPWLILLFVRYAELSGANRADFSYRLSIHESADVPAASRWWADQIGVAVEHFKRPALKKHNPSTVRRNVGDSYRGCLIIYVPKPTRLYWEIEGIMRAIAASVGMGGAASM